MLKALKKQKSGSPEALIDNDEQYEMVNLRVNMDIAGDINDKPVQCLSEDMIQENQTDLQCRIVDECDIVDGIITTTNIESMHSFKKSIKDCSNICVLFLLFITIFCNMFLLYLIYDFCVNQQRDPIKLLYIAGIAVPYLFCCGLYQTFNYPQYRTSINELQYLLNELIASYVKIKMVITGCNLFIKNEETNKFNKIFHHSIETNYKYNNCQDISDDFDVILNSLINKNYCYGGWHIIELDINFNIKCGDQQTGKDYVYHRNNFIKKNVKARKQQYVSSALYLNDDGLPLNNNFIGDCPIEIGNSKQFWIINEKSWFTQLIIHDITYWVFSVFLLSQWLYVFIVWILISKRQRFTVCKEIYK